MKVKYISHSCISGIDDIKYRNYNYLVCKQHGLIEIIRIFRKRYVYVYTEFISINKVKIVINDNTVYYFEETYIPEDETVDLWTTLNTHDELP